MTLETQLRDALAAFMRTAAVRDPARTTAALNRITGLQRQLGADAHPMLRHYLEQRSYQKALDFLNPGQPETETQQCGD